MKILLDSPSVVIAVKPAGVLSERSESGGDAVTELEAALGAKVFPVHRLDRAVGGVMAFAKTRDAASALSSPGSLKKEYIAVVHGDCGDGGEMRDLLFKDSRTNKSYVVKRMRRGVREASLTYRKIAGRDGMSLVSIELQTGRSHQIRVQFSSRGCPLVGDGKYGASDGCGVALFCRSVAAEYKGKSYCAADIPDVTAKPWNLFADVLKSFVTEDL